MTAPAQPRFEAPWRQIHLDFSAPGALLDVGAQFDPEAFALTLKQAHASAVTCCARCRYGWLYYDSRLFPERVHPHLVHRNLLAAQIEACHRHGLRVPVFTTVHWDLETAREHPEWAVVEAGGEAPGADGAERPLCVNTPYRAFLKAHVGELLRTLPLDGLVLEGGAVRACACPQCQAGMAAEGLDPADAAARLAYARRLRRDFMADMAALVRAERPEISLAFTGAEAHPEWGDVLRAISYVAFDVVPGGAEFSVQARRQRALGVGGVGRTSRFHLGWENGPSYKSRPALEFDCYRLLSHGCQVMIGDRLPASGALDSAAYDLIQPLYADVALKEPWCRGARPVSEIAVLDAERFGGTPETNAGCARLLEEGGYQFDLVDGTANLAPYAVLILPDSITLDEALAAKIEAYLAQGGRLLASFESGLEPSKARFRLKALGVECLEAGAAHGGDAGSLRVSAGFGQGLLGGEHCMYAPSLAVASQPGAAVLADVVRPETGGAQRPPGGAGVVQHGPTLYFAHKLFELYARYAPGWVRRLFYNALDRLLPEPLLRHDGPSTLLAAVTEQAAHQRWVVHLLHYVPQRCAYGLETVDDIIPLHAVKLSLKVPREVRQVAIRPQQYDTLEFWENAGRLEFVVPTIEGHTLVEIQFA